AQTAAAPLSPEVAMNARRQVDSRRHNPAHRDSAGRTALAAPPRLNAVTATPVTVPALVQPPSDHSLVDRALAFVSRERANMGFGATDVSEFAPDPVVQRTSAGAATVHLHQRYRGLPVFQMIRSVRFNPQSQVVDAIGDSAPIPAGINVAPRLSVVDAVLR